MDVREKLAEIVCNVMESDGCIGHCNHPPCFEVERVVNALIANGVTVQEWIPVTERLPEIGRKCLIANREIVVRGWLRPDGVWKTGVSSDEIWSKFSLYPPTHWMPLPEQPKEEREC